MALPRFIVLQSIQKDFLGYKHEGVKNDGYLTFSESHAVSPYAKFEVELSKTNGLVHIRSCQNNKYWRRTNGWATATAETKEEDKSLESCTLFKFISVDSAMGTFRITHVQTQNYLCLWLTSDRYVKAAYKVYDHQSCDIFTIIDWSSLLILPRYLAFKGEGAFSATYLSLRPYFASTEFLMFQVQDKGDPRVACEIIPTADGKIRLKQNSTQNFWRRRQTHGGDWLVADTVDTSSADKNTVFRPVKVNENTIALINLGNNRFCMRNSNNRTGIKNCLDAKAPSITNEVRLTVEEAVMTREIYGSRYDVDSARVYNQSVLLVASNSVSNHTQQTQSITVRFRYFDIKTRCWQNSFSISSGIKASMEFKVPLISSAGVEISTEVQSVEKWGETQEIIMELTVEHTVVAPPMTKVTVNLVATQGMCDVPLTYIHRDTLYDGTSVITEIIGSYYTGANYYNLDFEDKEEPVNLID